jgi:hypothetical protein
MPFCQNHSFLKQFLLVFNLNNRYFENFFLQISSYAYNSRAVFVYKIFILSEEKKTLRKLD